MDLQERELRTADLCTRPLSQQINQGRPPPRQQDALVVVFLTRHVCQRLGGYLRDLRVRAGVQEGHQALQATAFPDGTKELLCPAQVANNCCCPLSDGLQSKLRVSLQLDLAA